MDDAELLKAFAEARDEAAFAQLVDRHGPMVLGICRRLLGNSADADDAFQATFLLLAMRAGRIREPRLIGNWLFGVATRTSLMARRSTARRIVQEKRLMRILGSPARSETDDADLRMTLDEQVHRLPDKLRRVIVCHHLQGLTTRETAEQLKWPESTVMARLKKARALLKERLSRRGLSTTDAMIGATIVAVALPAMLRASTVQAGAAVTIGKAGTSGIVSAKAAAMAKGTAKAMFVTKLKLAAAIVVASTLTIAGATAMAPQSSPAAPQQVAAVLHLPAAIEQAMRDNESKLDPINLAWTDHYTVLVAKEDLPKGLEFYSGLSLPFKLKLTMQKGLVYGYHALGDKQISETAYDGKYFYLGVTLNGKRDSQSKFVNTDKARKEKRQSGDRGDTMIGDGWLTDMGLRGLSTYTELEIGHADPVVIAMLTDGAIVASIDNITRDGAALARLKIVADDPNRAFADRSTRADVERYALGMTKRSREKFLAQWVAYKSLPQKRDYYFDLDPAKNYAVVAREERYGERTLSITRGADFRQLPGRMVWLPQTITRDWYTPMEDTTTILDKPLVHREGKLTEISVTPLPAEKFVIDYPELRANRRFDQTKAPTGSGQKEYPTTTPVGVPKPAPGYQPLADVPAAENASATERSWNRWGIIGGVVVLLLGIAAVGFERFRRSRARR